MARRFTWKEGIKKERKEKHRKKKDVSYQKERKKLGTEVVESDKKSM